MNPTVRIALLAVTAFAAACSEKPAQDQSAANTASDQEQAMTTSTAESFQIAPGLDARILKAGSGEIAEAGHNVVVHYTGWLYDDTAPDNRGEKFDSSVDRGQHFQFPLGAGRVIRGWDQGVVGMAVGEVRELTIAPEMGYGDRGAGAIIPPGATLVFEVELFDLNSIGGG